MSKSLQTTAQRPQRSCCRDLCVAAAMPTSTVPLAREERVARDERPLRPSASYRRDTVESFHGGNPKSVVARIGAIALIITIVAFTSAFFPHAESLAAPSLLDIVQRYNIDNPTAELLTTLRLPMPDDPRALVTKLAERLDCTDSMVVSSPHETRLTAANAYNDYTLSIRLHPVASLWGEKAELKISLTSVHPGIAAETEQKLRDLVSQLRRGYKTPVLVTISGTLPPERIDRTQKDLIAKAFASIDGEILEGISDDHLESWSGYTNRLPDSITVGRNKLNLQIATRYASDADTVIIKIGAPLIIGTY